MLVNSKSILIDAVKKKYAVPHFNFHNLDNARAIIEVAHEMRSPLVLAVTPGTVAFSGSKALVSVVRGLCRTYPDIPVALHSDHHHRVDEIMEGIFNGFTSVMIDLSQKPFKENIAGTQKIVNFARQYGVTVEAELGSIPGVEDDLVVEDEIINDPYTKPEKVVEFLAATNVDSLAVAIGTVHGLYKSRPKLNYQRIKELKAITDIPLVLHGASGLSDEEIKACVKAGINKINIATDLKKPFIKGIIDYYHTFDKPDFSDRKLNDPRAFLAPAINNIKAVVKHKIKLCNAQNRY